MQKLIYIGTGKKQGFYTLHVAECSNYRIYDNYIQNLSTDWDTAVAKAKAFAKTVPDSKLHLTPFELDGFGKLRSSDRWELILESIDPTYIPFGKYHHQTVENVIKQDPDYLWWLVHNMTDTKDVNIPFRVYLATALSESGTEDPIEARQRKYEERQRKDKEIHDNASPVPTSGERMTFTGEVIATKLVDTHFGETLKMLFRDDRGFKLWGSVPSSIEGLENESVKGKRISFVARVDVSNDDEKFGFFKRPTKTKVIGE